MIASSREPFERTKKFEKAELPAYPAMQCGTATVVQVSMGVKVLPRAARTLNNPSALATQ